MKTIIIYGSNYGHAKIYAAELAKRLKLEIFNYTEIKKLTSYNCIIYVGGLYAGGVKGFKKTTRKITNNVKKVILITVGISNPNDKINQENIKKSIENKVAKNLFSKIEIYNLRGGLDYSKLNFVHRFMMRIVYASALKKQKSGRIIEDQAIINTYGKKINFINLKSLEPIIEHFKAQKNNYPF